MREKNHRYSFAGIGQGSTRVLNREKSAAALLATALVVLVASSFGGVQTGILVYHSVILTLLALLIHKYAKSSDAMARATVDLGKASRRETLLLMARTISEEKETFGAILEELQEAQKTPRPPFELSAWERARAKLESLKDWTTVDVEAISSCYEHLSKENTQLRVWEELEQRLEGLVNVEKRRNVTMTLKALEHENLSAIRPVVAMLASHLKH